ncbi:MAG: hypothetical protein ABW221_05765 [Vicinamibacteria bacterium]
MTPRRAVAGLLAALLSAGAGGSAHAADPWEDGDDTSVTTNILRHGVVQQGHDLDVGAGLDSDWSTFVSKARHSYEARVTGRRWGNFCQVLPCVPFFDRVDAAGAVLTPGSASSEDIAAPQGSEGRTVRWISAAGGREYLHARTDGPTTALTTPYDIVMFDTTLFLPRWNSTASQTTVLILQNTTNATVTGSVYFYDGAGALLATEAVSVPEHGVQILSTASLPALAGRSGSAQVAQTGGYAALAGKAVALEPATGFTFDTAITPLPY